MPSDKKTNIIIVSHAFPPINHISSVRPSKLAKYFLRHGCNVTVITSVPEKGERIDSDDDYHSVVNNINIIRVPSKQVDLTKYLKVIAHLTKTLNENARLTSTKSGAKTKKIRWHQITTFIDRLASDLIWYHHVRNTLKSLNIYGDNYDLIFSTNPPIGPLLVANDLKLNTKAFWIADFRDSPFLPSIMNNLLIKVQRLLIKHFLKNADLVTVISDGIKTSIHQNMRNLDKPIRTVYNGYDMEDFPLGCMSDQSRAETKLNITYTGALYNNRRDASLLFCAIEGGIEEGLFTEDNFEIHYAGREFHSFKEQASKYKLTRILDNHGNLTRKESLLLQHKSDVLLLLTWNTIHEQGIITGKFSEYLMMRKIILAIITGDLPNSEIFNIITKNQLGIACEEYHFESSNKELKNYLLYLIDQKSKGRSLLLKKCDFEEFNYAKLASRIIKLIKTEI